MLSLGCEPMFLSASVLRCELPVGEIILPGSRGIFLVGVSRIEIHAHETVGGRVSGERSHRCSSKGSERVEWLQGRQVVIVGGDDIPVRPVRPWIGCVGCRKDRRVLYDQVMVIQ